MTEHMKRSAGGFRGTAAMNRRGFLGLLAAAPAALLVPTRSIFLPPRGGWPVDISWCLTGKDAWFLQSAPLSEESLERMLVSMVRHADALGRRITYHPTHLNVHPSWTREQIEARLSQL